MKKRKCTAYMLFIMIFSVQTMLCVQRTQISENPKVQKIYSNKEFSQKRIQWKQNLFRTVIQHGKTDKKGFLSVKNLSFFAWETRSHIKALKRQSEPQIPFSKLSLPQKERHRGPPHKI